MPVSRRFSHSFCHCCSPCSLFTSMLWSSLWIESRQLLDIDFWHVHFVHSLATGLVASVKALSGTANPKGAAVWTRHLQKNKSGPATLRTDSFFVWRSKGFSIPEPTPEIDLPWFAKRYRSALECFFLWKLLNSYSIAQCKYGALCSGYAEDLGHWSSNVQLLASIHPSRGATQLFFTFVALWHMSCFTCFIPHLSAAPRSITLLIVSTIDFSCKVENPMENSTTNLG